MGALAIADLVLGLFGKFNLGAEEALRFWRAVKQKNPDFPDRTDAEVIDIMTNQFKSNREAAQAALDALNAKDDDHN
jgi:hypothetical protein